MGGVGLALLRGGEVERNGALARPTPLGPWVTGSEGDGRRWLLAIRGTRVQRVPIQGQRHPSDTPTFSLPPPTSVPPDPPPRSATLFPADFVASVNRSSLVGVSAGETRPVPLQIWVVAVEGRLFARSWGLSEKSWYFTFLSGSKGFLECEGRRIAVVGRSPPDLGTITGLIDAEYLRKYDKGDNSKYARGIVGREHVLRTLEFVPVDEAGSAL